MSISGLGKSGQMMRIFGMVGMQTPDASLLARNIMRQRDINSDNVLNASEAVTLPMEFDGSDTNGDGIINLNELMGKINAKLGEAGISSGSREITNISQLKYMVAQMSLDLLIPITKSTKSAKSTKSGYDFEKLLINQFELSNIEVNSLIETMKGNPMDLFG